MKIYTENFTILLNKHITNKEIDTYEFRVMCYLLMLSNNGGTCYPSYKTNADRIVNCVNFKNGSKIHFTPNSLKVLRDISDEICISHSLSVLPPYQKGGRSILTREYRAAEKDQSWKFRLMSDIQEGMKCSGNREQFTKELFDGRINQEELFKFEKACTTDLSDRDMFHNSDKIQMFGDKEISML